jgi:hypothetical protein
MSLGPAGEPAAEKQGYPRTSAGSQQIERSKFEPIQQKRFSSKVTDGKTKPRSNDIENQSSSGASYQDMKQGAIGGC